MAATTFLLTLLLIFNSVLPSKKETIWLADKNGKKLKKESYKEFNDKGALLKVIEYLDEGEDCRQFEYTYKNGNKTQEVFRFCNSKFPETRVFIYDATNRLIKTNKLNEKGKLFEYETHAYTGKGKNIVSTKVYDVNEQDFYSETTFEYYPGTSLVKKEIQYAGGSWFQAREYKYDDKGNLIYMGEEADGGVGKVQYFYTYKNNRIIKDKVIVPDTGVEYHIYEYQ